MYLGTVFGRSLDSYTWNELIHGKAEWLPPNLTAVHYALSGAFATRDNFLNHLIRSSPHLSAGMTVFAMLVEGLVAPACLVLVPRRHRHWCAACLVSLHFGLLLSLRLPQWQYLAMLSQTLWIPSHIWDRLPGLPLLEGSSLSTEEYKKTDGDPSPATTFNTNTTTLSPQQQYNTRSNPVSRLLQLFWFLYMFYNFAGERRWIPKHDKGDIGEALRLSQYWVMYAKVGRTAHNTILTGIYAAPVEEEEDIHQLKKDGNSRRIDLLEYIRTGRERNAEPVDFVPQDMSRRFPSARWERALHSWASKSFTNPEYGRQRGEQLGRALCRLFHQDRLRAAANDDTEEEGQRLLHAVELRFQHLSILPPGSDRRYAEKRAKKDTVVTVPCPGVTPPPIGRLSASSRTTS